MRNLQPILAAAIVAGTLATLSSTAEARHQRYAETQANYVCGPVPPPLSLIYPEENWRPFFRRHFYRYGPILACAPSLVTTNVISVRY
jgi:hypothetical protein